MVVKFPASKSDRHANHAGVQGGVTRSAVFAIATGNEPGLRRGSRLSLIPFHFIAARNTWNFGNGELVMGNDLPITHDQFPLPVYICIKFSVNYYYT